MTTPDNMDNSVQKSVKPMDVRFVKSTAAALTLTIPLLVAQNAWAQMSGGGTPDLSGFWDPDTCTPDGECPWFQELPTSEWGQASLESFVEFASPKYDCVPATAPGIVFDPYFFEIEQLEDRVIMRYEKDDVVRTVWMDGRQHPELGREFSWQGHAIGRYENGELVVDTFNFYPDPIGIEDFLGLGSSAQKHVVERYGLNGQRLYADVTVVDPVFLSQPASAHFEWIRAPENYELIPYDCAPDMARQPLQHADPERGLNLMDFGGRNDGGFGN
ncbi:MAG TPA: hypothetical protein VIV14_09860 [Gammaproteobacteria bacterium]